MTRKLPWRLDDAPEAPFPPAETALRHPDGLLAIGGDLHPLRLLNAYAGGIFPWFSEGEPLLWWSPDPRTVFRTDGVHLSRRFQRSLRGLDWTITADTAFVQVMRACAAAPRPGQDGTWISEAMVDAYGELHRLGFAHSIEVWSDETLVGGIYGVGIGRMFFGESMFSAMSGGSKIALSALAWHLRQNGVPLLDAQVENPHLLRMGATSMGRGEFLAHVRQSVTQQGIQGDWKESFGRLPVAALAGH